MKRSIQDVLDLGIPNPQLQYRYSVEFFKSFDGQFIPESDALTHHVVAMTELVQPRPCIFGLDGQPITVGFQFEADEACKVLEALQHLYKFNYPDDGEHSSTFDVHVNTVDCVNKVTSTIVLERSWVIKIVHGSLTYKSKNAVIHTLQLECAKVKMYTGADLAKIKRAPTRDVNK